MRKPCLSLALATAVLVGPAATAGEFWHCRGGIPNSEWFFGTDRPGYQYVFYCGNELLSMPDGRDRYSAAMNAAAREKYGKIAPREIRNTLPGGSEFARYALVWGQPVYGHLIWSGHLVVLDFALGDRAIKPERAARNLDAILRQILDFRRQHSRIVVYAATPEMLEDYLAGRTPRYIEECEKVCAHWNIPSINLARAAAESVTRGDTAKADYFAGVNGTPNAKAAAVYTKTAHDAMAEILDAAPPSKDGWKTPYPLLEPLYPDSRPYGRILAYEDARIARKGPWTTGQKSPLAPFRHLLTCSESGAEIAFSVTNATAVGLLDVVGAGTADIRWQVDGGAWHTLSAPKADATNVTMRTQLLAEGLDPSVPHRFALKTDAGVTRIGGFLVNGFLAGDPVAEESPEAVGYVPPQGRFRFIQKTMAKLRGDGSCKMVVLGDSLIQDTMASNFDKLLQADNPRCRLEAIGSTRSGTGCAWYRQENRLDEYVFRYDPMDLLVIGGISHGKNPEVVRDVIRQVRARHPEQEILVISPIFSTGVVEDRLRLNPDRDPFRQALAKIAEEERCAYFDMQKPICEYINASGKVPGWFMRDGCHSNARGQWIIAQLMRRWFRTGEETVRLPGRGHLWARGDRGTQTSAWFRVKQRVPAEWKGSRVAFSVPHALLQADLVLELNGKKVGEILRPAGDIDVSEAVRYGEENAFAWMLTRFGAEARKGQTLWADMDHRNPPGLTRAPELTVTPWTRITDVFCNPSWREKRLRVEIEVTCGEDPSDGDLSVAIRDEAGAVVKSAARAVALKAGVNAFALEIPWDDPNTWELGRPYLYTAAVACARRSEMGARGEPTARTVRFGFREVWRDGRQIIMNGHPVHFRTCYSYAASKWGARFLRNVGHNVVTINHKSDGCTLTDTLFEQLDGYDEAGVGCFISCGGGPAISGFDIHLDRRREEIYRQYQKTFQRATRNHPSIVAEYVTQMVLSDTKSHDPTMLGQYVASGPRFSDIETWRRVNREYNPNVLYYSHADGPNGDLASGNLYLNFTPLQEREEWLSQWAEKGTWPWHSAEFGQPYDGNWYWQRLFLGTEHLAQIFGDRAYAEETPAALTNALEIADKAHPWGHGCDLGHLTMQEQPLFWEMQRIWTKRTNTRWRAFGFNGGNDYFNLHEAYGTPPGTMGYGRYGIKGDEEDLLRKPSWANEGYDIHRLGNLDFCGFLGGEPDFADRTHAYWTGERIEKQAVLIWDGFGDKRVWVEWTLERPSGARATVASGRFAVSLKQGERTFVPFSLTAPNAERKEAYVLKISFVDEGALVAFDSQAVEVYPDRRHPMYRVTAPQAKVALFDPKGESAPVLDALGIPYEKIDSLAFPSSPSASPLPLVIGRNALDDAVDLAISPKTLKDGLKVLYLVQAPEVWQAMGFTVQDTMSRELYLRERQNPAYRFVTDDMLAHWRGAPKYGKKAHGPIMRHASQRGPRWTRRHTVAGCVLEIPTRVGFAPVVDGEFDMNYAAVLRFRAGKGALTFCTLDLESRVGTDPAATAVAAAVFNDFLKSVAPTEKRELPSALRLKATLVSRGKVYKAEPADAASSLVAAPALFRWPTGLTADVAADGAFDLKADAFLAEVAANKGEKHAQQYEMCRARIERLFARVATAQGAEPDDEVIRRVLYRSCALNYEPLPDVHILGPFEARDDSDFVVTNVFPGEEMAIAGDYNPNIVFDLPQGGTTEWRLTLGADEKGLFDFRRHFPNQRHPVYLAICNVARETAGEASLLFGVDWRAKIWCNGEVVKEVPMGMNYPGIEVPLKLKAGKNVLAFKIGGGTKQQEFYGLLERERTKSAGNRPRDEALEKVSLYDNRIRGFDPYVFHYW